MTVPGLLPIGSKNKAKPIKKRPEILTQTWEQAGRPPMKIFEANQIEWVAAPSAEHVLLLMADMGYVKESEQSEATCFDAECYDEPRELSDEEMDRLKRWSDEDGGELVTFRETLAKDLAEDGTLCVYIFASTEY